VPAITNLLLSISDRFTLLACRDPGKFERRTWCPLSGSGRIAGRAANGDYCSFTKAVEHLGDRWSLVILRELLLHRTRGFNALVGGLPGISRSVLAARLRKLEELGLIARDPEARTGVPGYRLTPAGLELQPIMHGLWTWSKRWVPQDPVWAERDPDIIMAWLGHRVDPLAAPAGRIVVEFDIQGTRAKRGWLVLERDTEPAVCLEDPCLGPERYVYVEGDAAALFPIARGSRDWREAMADGSVRVFGEPELVRQLPGWFRDAGQGASAASKPIALA
jgi:DNA-binding HxlR family transcriptional regulator